MVAVFTGELPVEIGWFDLSVDGQMNRVNSRNGHYDSIIVTDNGIIIRQLVVAFTVSLLVYLSVCSRLWAGMGQRNHVLDRGPDPPLKAAILRGKGDTLYSIETVCRELCKNG